MGQQHCTESHTIIASLCPGNATSRVAIATAAIITIAVTIATTITTTTEASRSDRHSPQDSAIGLLEVPEV